MGRAIQGRRLPWKEVYSHYSKTYFSSVWEAFVSGPFGGSRDTNDTLLLILAAIQAGGGGGVTWPLQFGTPVTTQPAATGKWQLYILSDGVASPNNIQTAYLMPPDGGEPFFIAQKTV